MKNKLLNRKQVTQLFSLLTFLLLIANTAVGQNKTFTWGGATSNDWTTSTNWDTSGSSNALTTTAFSAGATSLTLSVANSSIDVGDAVSAGTGITLGTTITSIDVTRTIIGLSAATTGSGSSVTFTFIVAAASNINIPNSSTDYIVISNGGTPTLASPTSVTVERVTISNATGLVSGSTLTINSGATLNVNSASISNVLLNGGNIINNGTLNITSTSTAASSGITCGTPSAVVTSPAQEYSYSGTGILSINISAAATNNSCAIVVSGTNANSTYRIALTSANTTFTLGSNGAFSSFAFRANGGLGACPLIIDGTGVKLGTTASKVTGGLIGLSTYAAVTINPTVTLEMNSLATTTANGLNFFSGASSSEINFTNKGIINIFGDIARSGINVNIGSGSTAALSNANIIITNDGIINVDVNAVTVGNGSTVGYAPYTGSVGAFANINSFINFTNNGTLTLRNSAVGTNLGYSYFGSNAGQRANTNFVNNGTCNLDSTISNIGQGFTFNNNGTINSNNALGSHLITNNNSGGVINFTKVPVIFTVTAATASAGDVYRDTNLNLYTVRTSISGSTTLVAAIDPIAATIPTSGSLTWVSGNAGSTMPINYSAFAAVQVNAILNGVTTNLGTINTGALTFLGVVNSVSVASTGVIDPGGASRKGIASYTNGSTLAINSTLKLQVAGNTTAGIDYDQIRNTTALGGFNLTNARLDVTGITGTATPVDIVIANATGTLTGPFASVTGLPSGWTVTYTANPGGKVQLVYSAPAGTISEKTGNWSASSTWVGGVVPTAATANVIISAGHTVTADTAVTRDSGTTTTVDSGGALATNLTYTNNGTTAINGIFQINQGGFGGGSGTWTYGSASTLIYNHTSSTYGPIDGSHTYWPASNGPANVTIVNSLGAGTPNGINLGVARTVTGIFQTAAGVTNANNLTVNGSLQLNAGGFVSGSPTYGSSSTLIYNSATYGRGDEWNATSGAGYPANVRIGNGVNTTLNVVNSSAVYRRAAGNLIVSTGSTLSISGLTTGIGTVGLEFLGNINNDGTITLDGGTNGRLKAVNLNNGVAVTNGSSPAIVNLSAAIGGDLELTGNYNDNATFNANQRAVFFTGGGAIQTIGGNAPGTFNIDYMVVTRTAVNGVQLLRNIVIGAPAGGTGLTLTSATNDILDLNARTLTLGTALTACTVSGSGLIKSIAGSLVINGTGALGTLAFDVANNTLVNLTINRTAGTGTPGVTLGTALNVTTTVSLASTSTLTLGGNLAISSATANTVAGIIAGTGSLVKTGAGVLTLSAVSGNNTGNAYSVGTTISAGSINVTGLTNITSTVIGASTQVVTFTNSTPANGTYKLLAGGLTVTTPSFSHNANATKAVSFDYPSSTVTVASGPAIILGGTTTTAFTTTYGAASTAQTFAVSGGSLTADLVATAPTGFQVSSDGITYGGTATFIQTSGAASGSLRIRLTATAPVLGSYNSNNIVLSSTGVTSVNIVTPASGNVVNARALTITASNQSKQFGNTLYTGPGITVFTTSTLYNGDTIGSINIASTGAAPEAIVDSYSIVPSAATGGTFVSSNYTITYATTGALTVTAPATTDYRTVSSGDWTELAIWEKWNGTAWVQPTALEGYPTQTTTDILQNVAPRIYILNSHNVTCGIGVADASANRATRIEINAGSSPTSLTFTSTNYFSCDGASIVLNSTGAGNALLDVGNANIYSSGTLSINKSTGGGINKVLINNALLNFGTNITMGGLAAETFIEFTGSGTLVSSGGTISGGTIIAGTGTVDYRAAANQTAGTYTYNNLTLSNRNVASNASYTKTLTSGTIINGNLTISGSTGPSTVASTIASLNAGSTYNVDSLILGTTGAAAGTWGYDATSGATNFDTTYFANTTGKVNAGKSAPAVTPIIGSYTYTGSPVGPNSVTTASTGVVTYSYVGVPASSYTASATQPRNAGNYTVTATIAASGDGLWAARSSTATAFTIATAALTITANDATNPKGTTFLTGAGSTNFTPTGLQNGEGIGTITIASTGAASASDFGTYPIVPSAAIGGTFTASNYTITYANGTLTVGGTTGDYRTVQSGNWTSLATWERWNGSSWVTPALDYPGQDNTVQRAYISNGHNITVDANITYRSNFTRLEFLTSTLTASTSLVFAPNVSLSFEGALVAEESNGNVTISVGSGALSCAQMRLTNSTGAAEVSEINVSTGSVTLTSTSTGIQLNGTTAKSIFRFTDSGTLSINQGITGTGAFIAGTSTVTFGYFGAQSVPAYAFHNVVLSGSGIKTFAVGTSFTRSLTVSGTGAIKANLPATANYTIPSLVFGTIAQTIGTYGSTVSVATVKTDDYFDSAAGATGIITILSNLPLVLPNFNANYTYNGLPRSGTPTNSGTGTDYTYSYASNGGTPYSSPNAPTNVGNYFVTVTVAANGVWGANSSAQTGFAIVPRPLTITADNQSKQFGFTHPTGAGSIAYSTATLQNVDTIGSVTIESTGAVNTAPVGTYDIVPSLATGGTFNPSNYSISYVNGTLTVSNATTGDYRSVASTNWSSLTTWERWSGSAWATPTTAATEGWPGQYAVASRVFISDNTTVTADVSIFGTNRPTRLEFTPDANNAVLNINSGVSLGINGNVVIAAPGLGANTGDAILNVGSGSLPIQGLLRLNDTQGSSNDCELRIGTGSVSVSGTDARMLGAVDENLIIFDGAGTLSTLGGTTVALAGNGTFTAGTGTVIFNGAAQTVGPYAFYNLTLKGSGFKTVSATATIAGNLTIEDDTAKAILSPGITYSVNTLTLGCRETENGTWGSTDADPTDYVDDDYFEPTNGKINVSLDKSLKIPVTSGPQPTCENPTVTITVAEQYPNQMYSFDNGTSWQVSNVSTPLPFGTYAVLIQNSRGCSTSPVKTVILVTPTKTWIGTAGAGGSNWTNGDNWSPSGVPAPTNCISIPDVLTNDLIIDGDITASLYSLTVGAGGSVTVNSGSSLKITDFINVDPAGTLTVQNNANLVQINNATNTGNILYNRATPPLLETDYTYWSSPVVGQTLTAISPVNYPEPGSYFYSFNNSSDQWSSPLSGSTVMLPGVGYIMRGQDIPGPNIAATFTGVPRNGPQIVQSLSTSNSLLIGNPYPSAIDADLFLDFNKDFIEGTIYFWTHRTPITNLVYSADDYASYNFTGGVGTGTASASLSSVPTGKIAATQGFFATSKAVGDVTFNNSMRLDGSGVPFNNSNFYKTANSQKPNAFEKHRVWLDLTNTQGAFKQMLVGYITNATNEYDSAFDGKSFDGNEFVDFYSINQNQNLTIQGRAVPFDENDAVPLGFRSKLSGEFSINIHKVDGVLTNQDIVIEDKLTNTFVNLKNGSFTFSTVAGTFNNRFVLRFKDKTLGTNDLSGHTSKILISVKNKQIKINSFAENIDKVAIYDLLGRQIYQKTKVSGNELILSNFASSNQTLLVKVTLENGITVTEKVIY